MKFELTETEWSLLYIKAKNHLNKCIQNKDNEFLKHEVQLANITVIDGDIKVVLSKKESNKYCIEINLLLFEENKEIGRYLYVENEKNEAVDDSLVFY